MDEVTVRAVLELVCLVDALRVVTPPLRNPAVLVLVMVVASCHAAGLYLTAVDDRRTGVLAVLVAVGGDSERMLEDPLTLLGVLTVADEGDGGIGHLHNRACGSVDGTQEAYLQPLLRSKGRYRYGGLCLLCGGAAEDQRCPVRRVDGCVVGRETSALHLLVGHVEHITALVGGAYGHLDAVGRRIGACLRAVGHDVGRELQIVFLHCLGHDGDAGSGDDHRGGCPRGVILNTPCRHGEDTRDGSVEVVVIITRMHKVDGARLCELRLALLRGPCGIRRGVACVTCYLPVVETLHVGI